MFYISLFEYQIATVNGETEIEIIRIDSINTNIVLNIVFAVRTMHRH